MTNLILNKMGFVKGEPLKFQSRRVCGLWLLWVSFVILIGTVLGGTQQINMPIFDVGYFLGFLLILGNKRVYKRLAFGSPSKFQKNMIFASIILMFVLLVGLGGQYFPVHNYRMIWIMAFLAIGLHFFPFALVHGKIMLPLAALVSLNALIGVMNPTIDFHIIAYLDIALKSFFAILLLRSKST